MKNFIICVLTEIPELLINATTITTMNMTELDSGYRIHLKYVDVLSLENKTKILKDLLKKHDIKYTSTEKKDEHSELHTISFTFNDTVIECWLSAFTCI